MSESSESESNSFADSASNEKRIPSCARCRNHNVWIQVKGHKRDCEWARCSCSKCDLITQRQNLNKKQNELRREQDRKDAKRAYDSSPMSAVASARSSEASSPCSAKLVLSPPPNVGEENVFESRNNSPVGSPQPIFVPAARKNQLSLVTETDVLNNITNFVSTNDIHPRILFYAILDEFDFDVEIASDYMSIAYNKLRDDGLISPAMFHPYSEDQFYPMNYPTSLTNLDYNSRRSRNEDQFYPINYPTSFTNLDPRRYHPYAYPSTNSSPSN